MWGACAVGPILLRFGKALAVGRAGCRLAALFCAVTDCGLGSPCSPSGHAHLLLQQHCWLCCRQALAGDLQAVDQQHCAVAVTGCGLGSPCSPSGHVHLDMCICCSSSAARLPRAYLCLKMSSGAVGSSPDAAQMRSLCSSDLALCCVISGDTVADGRRHKMLAWPPVVSENKCSRRSTQGCSVDPERQGGARSTALVEI